MALSHEISTYLNEHCPDGHVATVIRLTVEAPETVYLTNGRVFMVVNDEADGAIEVAPIPGTIAFRSMQRWLHTTGARR